jgi:hypothetical protein
LILINDFLYIHFASFPGNNISHTWGAEVELTGEEVVVDEAVAVVGSRLVLEEDRIQTTRICHKEHHRQITFVFDVVKRVCKKGRKHICKGRATY